MTSPASESTVLPLEALAQRWGVSIKWLRRRIGAGELHAVRFGHLIRVPLAEAQRFERSRPAA